MSVLRRTRVPYTDTEYLRKHPDKRTPAGVAPVSEPGVIKMQHLVGNQAVQRMIQRQTQAGTGAVVQRAPDKKEQDSAPRVLATIVLANGGEFKGNCRIAGHEGKIEFLGLQIEHSLRRGSDARGESSENRLHVILTKPLDDLSPKLMHAIHSGDSIKHARFEFLRRDAEGKVSVGHSLEFYDGYMTALSIGGVDADGKTLETLSVEFPGAA